MTMQARFPGPVQCAGLIRHNVGNPIMEPEPYDAQGEVSGMNNETVWVNEGFVLNDAGHVVLTSYVDLRKPQDRAPITGLVRASERKYALEDCETIMISNPARYRSFGEELILDVQEGLAKEESAIASPETLAQATRRRAVSDLNQALEMLDTRMQPWYSESNNNVRKLDNSLTYGKEWWILCTSIRPNDEEWDYWKSTLSNNYDHVSEIGQPAKFAQALAHMVAEQMGPSGQECTLSNTTGGAAIDKSMHKSQWVLHGPVVYTDSVYEALDGIKDNKSRIAASIFTKGKEYAPQREYRFAVLNEGADEAKVKLQISGMMRDSLKPTEHHLVRHAPVLLNAGSTRETEPTQGTDEEPVLKSKQSTVTERVSHREEWAIMVGEPDGQVQSSETGARESVRERTVIQSQTFGSNEIPNPLHVSEVSDETVETPSTQNLLDDHSEPDNEKTDEDVAMELALEEFELEETDSEEDRHAIPIRTAAGRVYKSFEQMLSDPTYPLGPMGKVSEEDANTPDEITKTYRAIDVLDMKMKDIKEEFRHDVASAGWYAMLCIRNIYGQLGDIVDTLSIERERFVVIRLKDSEMLNASGKIVIAPTGAFAYSLHLPNEGLPLPKEEQIGYGGLEWGTKFFPMGDEIESFERYGWKKKMR